MQTEKEVTAMKPKHTPGPWLIGEKDENDICTKDGDVIATAWLPNIKLSSGVVDANARLIAAAPDLLEQVASLARFKAYVHKRLDDAGIPIDPESPHKAEGCRIGGRLDELLGQREALLEACEQMIESLNGSPSDFKRMLAAHLALGAAIARAKGHQSDPHHAHI